METFLFHTYTLFTQRNTTSTLSLKVCASKTGLGVELEECVSHLDPLLLLLAVLSTDQEVLVVVPILGDVDTMHRN